MRQYIFCGPTIAEDDAKRYLEAEFLGPAAQGDLYRVALERPDAIGLIDGYFDSVPSVGHKEILFALGRGVRVYGAASMGALRAAELAAFGMIGVGHAYERITSGELEDDDEVAVAHGAPDTGYRALSEAMINVRATLGRAVEEVVVSQGVAEVLTGIAKSAFYAERSWPTILTSAKHLGLHESELQALRDWLPSNAINQKRLDAISMLELMADHARGSCAPFEATFHFEHTVAWESLRRRTDSLREPEAHAVTHDLAERDAAVEEAQVGGAFDEIVQGALARTLAVEHARATGRVMESEVLYTAIESFREEQGLSSDARFEHWLEDNAIGDLEFFREEALARLVQTLYRRQAIEMLPNHLRSTGAYRLLAQRARDKARAVAAADPGSTDNGASCDEAALFRWYFVQHLRREVPADLHRYALALGLRDVGALRRVVWRERVYIGLLAMDGGV